MSKSNNGVYLTLEGIGKVYLTENPSDLVEPDTGEHFRLFKLAEGGSFKITNADIESSKGDLSKMRVQYISATGANTITTLGELISKEIINVELYANFSRISKLEEAVKVLVDLYDESFELENPEKILFSIGGKSIKIGDILVAKKILEEKEK